MIARGLYVISAAPGDAALADIAAAFAEPPVPVTDLAGLGAVLDAAMPIGPRVLGLIGHSVADRRELGLGRTVLAADDVAVVAFFRDRRAQLARLAITEIRLLGCCTAVRPEGQAAICAIAAATGVRVCGSIVLLSASAYDRDGLRPEYAAVYLADQDHLPVDVSCPLDPLGVAGGTMQRAPIA